MRKAAHYLLQRADGLYYRWDGHDITGQDRWHEKHVTVFIGKREAERAKRIVESRNPGVTLTLIPTTGGTL